MIIHIKDVYKRQVYEGSAGSISLALSGNFGDGTVQTIDGLALEISPLQVPSQVRGRKVIMGMRPEHMLLNTQGVPAEVEMVETLGSEQLVHCRCGKSTLVVRCTTRQLSESSAKVGDRVNVGPDGRHPLHWFEADTGRRVQGL